MNNRYTFTKITCYIGLIVQAIINNFLPILFVALQDIYSLSYEKLARLILVNFGTQIVTDLCAPKILKILGYRKASCVSQLLAGTGLLMLGILPGILPDHSYGAISISVVVYAVGSGLMEVMLSPMVEMLPSDNKSGSMAILHSFYCWGQAFTIIATTIMINITGFLNWYIIPVIWAVIPFLNAFSFLKVPIVEPSPDKKLDSFSQLIKRGNFRGYMLMMLCAGASEIAMAEWSSLFAQRALGMTKVIGDLAGPCAFALLMATGRVYYGMISKKVSFKLVMILLSILAACCYLVVAFSGNAVVSLIFCAVCGLAVSVFWPGLYSAGAKDFTGGGMIMYSVFALCGDIGCALGPWILGIAADIAGLNFGFGVTAVFPAVMLITALSVLKNNGCNSDGANV